MPRIALFTGNYNHIRDGVALTLNRLVAYLEDNGYEVVIFGPWAPKRVFPPRGRYCPVRSVSFPGRKEYRISMGLSSREKNVLDSFKPDLIQFSTPDALGYGGLKYAERNGIPAVAIYHTHFPSYLKYYHLGLIKPFGWSYLRYFYKKCRHVYVPTQSMLHELQLKGIETELKLWPRGVDTRIFTPSRRDYPWRRSLGFGDHEIVVAFVSRVVWEKNLKTVIRTFQKIKSRDLPVRTLVVGDGPALNEMKEQLPGTVFPGFLEGESLARAYASSDLFFFPSETETFGNVTLEAMSSGLPALVADAQGSGSLVEHGKSGFKADATDHEAFYRYICRLTKDSLLRKQMAEASMNKAGEYDWQEVLKNLTLYYGQILDAGK